MRWRLGYKGKFDIKYFYGALRESSSITFPWKSIWGVKAPHHVSFFVSTAAWGKILTTKPLGRRGFTIMDWCCLCKCDGESVDNLLLHCGEVFRLWSFTFRSFGVFWRIWLVKHSSNIWNLVPHCVMRIIWKERNSRIFEDLVLSGDKLIALFATIGHVCGDLLLGIPFRSF